VPSYGLKFAKRHCRSNGAKRVQPVCNGLRKKVAVRPINHRKILL
jgi:hypothetical protein